MNTDQSTELAALYEISSIPTSAISLEKLGRLVLDKAAHNLNASISLLYIQQPQSSSWRLWAVQGISAEDVKNLPLDNKTVVQALQGNQPISLTGNAAVQALGILPAHPTANQGLCHSIRSGNTTVALMFAFRPNAEQPFSSTDLALFNALTNRAGAALENLQLVSALEQRNRELLQERDQLRKFHNLTAQLDTAENIESLLNALTDLSTLLEIDHYAIYILEDSSLEHYKRSDLLPSPRKTYDYIKTKLRQVTHIADSSANADWAEVAMTTTGQLIQSLVIIPLNIHFGRAQGFIFFGQNQPNAFSDHLFEQIKNVGQQVSIALKNILSFEDARASMREAHLLLSASRLLSTSVASVALDDVYKTMNQVFFETGADKCTLGVFIEHDDQQVPIKVSIVDVRGPNLSDQELDTVDTVQNVSDLNESYLFSGLNTGRIITISDVSTDPNLSEDDHQLLSQFDIQAHANIPLFSKGFPFGFVQVEYKTPHLFSDREVALLRTLANQTTIAIEHAQSLAAREQRARQIQTGAEISKTATSILNQETLMDRAVNLIRGGFNLYYTGLFLVDSRGEWAVLQAGTGEAGRAQIAEGHKLSLSGQSMIGMSIRFKEARINLDVGEGAVRFDNPHLPLTRSEMALPLISRDIVIGALSIQSTEPIAFSQDDIVTLQIMADQVANAISNSTLFQKTQQTAQELGVLLDINRDISAQVERDELLTLIVTRAADIVKGDHGVIFLQEDEFLVPKAVFGGYEESIMSQQVALGDGPAGQAAVQHEPIFRHILEPDENTRLIPSLPNHVETAIAVPIQTEAEVIGVLLVKRFKIEKLFTETDAKLLEAVALQAAIAVKNAGLMEDIQQAQRETKLLYDLSRQIATANTVLEIAEVAVQKVPKLVFDRIVFVLRDDPNSLKNSWVEVIAVWDRDLPPDKFVGGRYSVEDVPLINLAIREQPIIIENFNTHPDIDEKSRQVFTGLGVKSAAIIPVRVEHRILGWVLAETTHEHIKFSQADILPILTIVDQASVTIDRLQKSASLQQANQQYFAMIDNMPGAVFHGQIEESRLNLSFVSDNIVDITGYSVDKFLDSTRNLIEEIIHPEDRENASNEIAAKILQQEPYQVNCRIITESGDIKYVSIRGRGIFDIHGQPTAIDSVMYDVTERFRLQEANEKRAAQFEAIAQVGQKASAILDVDALLTETVDLISTAFDFYYAGLFLLDEAQEWAVLRAGSGTAGRKMVDENHRLQRNEDSMVGWATCHGEARIASDVETESNRFRHPHLPLTRSEIALPLITRGIVIGALDVQSTEESAFSEDDIATLQLMANQVANAIENARLFEQRQRRLQEQAALAKVAQVASSTLDSHEIFQTTIDEISALFSVDTCSIFIHDDTYNNLKVVASFPDQQNADRIIPLTDNWLNYEQLQQKQPLQTQDKTLSRLLGADICCSVFVPVQVSNHLRGFIGLGRRNNDLQFSAEDMSLGEAFAQEIGTALEKAELFMAIQEREQSLLSIHQITLLANSSLDLKKILDRSSQNLAKVFDVDHCAFVIYNGDGTGTVLAEYPDLDTLDMTFSVQDAPFEKTLSEEKKVVFVQDVKTDPTLGEFRDLFLEMNLKSFLIIPLLIRGKLIGSFSLDVTKDTRLFTQQEIDLAQSISNTLAVAIDNAQLFEATETSLAEANLLYQTTQALLLAKSEETLFRTFIDKTAEADADSISVSLFHGQGDEAYLEVKDIWARDGGSFRPGGRHKLRGFFLEPFITQPNTLILEDVKHDERLNEDTRERLLSMNVTSMVILPIIVQQKVIGTVHITYKNRIIAFTPTQVRLFESLVQQLTIIWQNQQLVTSIEHRLRRERIIREVTHKIHAATGVDKVLQTTITELSKALDVPSGLAQLKVKSGPTSAQSKPVLGKNVSAKHSGKNGVADEGKSEA